MEQACVVRSYGRHLEGGAGRPGCDSHAGWDGGHRGIAAGQREDGAAAGSRATQGDLSGRGLPTVNAGRVQCERKRSRRRLRRRRRRDTDGGGSPAARIRIEQNREESERGGKPWTLARVLAEPPSRELE